MLQVLLVLGALGGGRVRRRMGDGWRRWWYAVGELVGRVELLHFDEGVGGVGQMLVVLLVLMVVRRMIRTAVSVMVELMGGGLICVAAAALAAQRGCLVGRVRVAKGGETQSARVGCGRSVVV